MRQEEQSKQPPGTAEYRVEPRRIAGSHRERLDQIEAAINELLELKRIESGDGAGVHHLASPRRSHVFGMSVVILALLVLLVLLLGTRSAHGQTPGQTTPRANEAVFDSPGGSVNPWKHQNTALIGEIWYVGNKTGTW